MVGKAEINIKQIFNLIGFFLVVEGLFMLLGLPFSLYYHDEQPYALLFSFFITSGTGGIIWISTRK